MQTEDASLVDTAPAEGIEHMYRSEHVEQWGPAIYTLTDEELQQRERAEVCAPLSTGGGFLNPNRS